jgi:hypothetical protein
MTVAEKIRAEQNLADRLEPYAGQWVAVADGDVKYHADSLGALLEQIDEEEFDSTTVFQVPEDGATGCYF